MRTRFLLSILGLYLAFALSGCSRKPADANDNANNSNPQTAADNNNAQPAAPAQEAPRERAPLVVPSGREITVRLGSAIGSKLSRPGETFTGTLEKDVMAGNVVAIPRGAQVNGTVVDAKPLGRFKGGATLEVRLDSINVNGHDHRVQAAAKTFTEKGKGKRTAVLAGGGAALGGLIGGLAGGGKGAVIGLAAGGGAGAGGAAFTGNKEIELPAESALTFELTHSLEIRQ
ncbi:MAG TPA: hypothetical protein VH350_00250 [Candidatus Sulfotelmatobacter sp.]|jgi:hypothetical protein|nr:hypothetical protein [Candidatus Sulfotelmatobacter sp.]